MTDLPVIMSGPMVLATLREIAAPGTGKTNTRRLAWGKPFGVGGYDEEAARDLRRDGYKVSGLDDTEHRIVWPPSPWQKVKAGDRLWVRETLTRSGGYIQYNADHRMISRKLWPPSWKQDPRPSIHMPRVLSRLTLHVAAVKVERLNAISEADSIAEGMVYDSAKGWWHVPGVEHPNKDFPVLARTTAREMFAALWDVLHGSGEWLANPEVVAITFKPVLANIDATEAQAA